MLGSPSFVLIITLPTWNEPPVVELPINKPVGRFKPASVPPCVRISNLEKVLVGVI